MSDPCQFLLQQCAFLQLKQVAELLADPECALWCLTDTHAVFVLLDKRGSYNPFLFDEQFSRAQQVLLVPVGELVGLAEGLGPLTVPVCWIHNTTRCGSMALCQLFALAPRTKVLQEPDAITSVLFRYWGGSPGLSALLGAVGRILCRSNGDVDLFVIKPRGHCIALLPILREVFPSSRHLFLYRDGQATITSMLKAFGSEPFDLLRRHYLTSPWVQRLCPSRSKSLLVTYAISNDPTLAWARDWTFFAPLSLAAKYAILWASIVREYLNNQQGVRALRYEDLLTGHDRLVQEMLLYCGVKESGISIILAGRSLVLEADQHRGSMFSSRRLRHWPSGKLGENQSLSALCRRFGVPDFTSRCGKCMECKKHSKSCLALVLSGTFGH